MFALRAFLCVCCVVVALGVDVAVIGGGIAGVTTVLEILHQHPGVKISLFESSPFLNVSTSALIAASMSFDEQTQFWGTINRDYMKVLDTLIGDGLSKTEAADLARWGAGMLKARVLGDRRFSTAYQQKFFNMSYVALQELIARHPAELCSSVVGSWCCDDPAARQALLSKGINCSTNLFGLYHVINSQDVCSNIDSSTATEYGYDLLDAQETISRVSNFLKHEDAAQVSCSIVQPRLSGYTRGEVLLPTLAEMFAAHENVTVYTSCDISFLAPRNGGDQVALGYSGDGCPLNASLFDRVVVTGGARASGLLATNEIDPQIDWQILPLYGFLVTGSALDVPLVPTVSDAQLGLGLQLEDRGQNLQAAFIRSTQDRMVRIGGGAQLVAHDADLTVPLPTASSDQNQRVFDPLELSRNISNAPHTDHSTGVRPVGYFVNFPLIKMYAGRWRNVMLYSGLGFHGYTMSWGAAKIVADLMFDRSVSDPDFADAFTLELGSEHNQTCNKYVPAGSGSTRSIVRGAIVAGSLFGATLLLVLGCSAFCRRKPSHLGKKPWADQHKYFGLVFASAIFVSVFFPIGWSYDPHETRMCSVDAQCGTNQVCQYGECLCVEGACFTYAEFSCKFEPSPVNDSVFRTSYARPVAVFAPIVGVLMVVAYWLVNRDTFCECGKLKDTNFKEFTAL
eukprot:c32264_g1_i1.p1 GENE.c32264_g1_i1~~c32264_g1_i1.p1  ORF type:complete len:687 (+),score=117.14 c32264_g1_i1:23-2062(+)